MSQWRASNWTDEKQSREEAERRERLEERRVRERKKKEDADARKGRKVAKHCVFPMIWGSGGSKSRLAKAAGAEPAGQMRDEKLHAVVARSTFPSQNVQNTPGFGPLLEVEMSKKCTPLWREAHFEVKMYKTHQVSDHFWKLRCRKSARRCGAKHISKSKCTKHTSVGPLLDSWDVEKVHAVVARSTFRSQNVQNTRGRTTFGSWDVEKVHAVVARSTFPSQNVQNTRGSDHFWRFRCRKSARRCGAKHISKSKCYKTLGVRTTFGVEMSKRCGAFEASLRFTTLHWHYTTLHYTTRQDITLHYTPVHYITLHYTPVHSTTLNYTTPHYITLHYAPLHYTTLHHITLHYTPLHYITLYYTIFHYTSLPYTTLHSITLQLQLQLH